MYAVLVVFSAIGFIGIVSLLANFLMLFLEEPPHKQNAKLPKDNLKTGKSSIMGSTIKSKNE